MREPVLKPASGRFSYSYVQDVLKSAGIDNVLFLDANYVLPGNDDDPVNGIVHGRFIDAINEYSDYLHKHLLKYTPELFDCDDFAWTFKAFCHMHKINGVGFAIGRLCQNDKFLGWHAFNIVPYAMSPNSVIVLLFEPQLAPFDGITPYNHGAKLWNLRYEVVEVIF